MDEERLADLHCSLDRRRRRFPAGATCSNCGEHNPLVLVSGRKRSLCRQCALLARGRKVQEEHHLGGRPSSQTIVVPANPHALLSFLQGIWRVSVEAGSNEAYLFDLLLVRTLGSSLGIELP